MISKINPPCQPPTPIPIHPNIATTAMERASTIPGTIILTQTRKEAINKEPTKHTYSNEQFEKYLDEFCSIEWVYLYDESKEQWFVKHVNHWDEYAPLNEFGINIIRGEYDN